mmetsp:Transcript_8036/g.11306  ORF Transcript_8036/g.11306 Transcript_8036/m.11306 type:complete len:91 (-) Transcript_8036:160-432(-)
MTSIPDNAFNGCSSVIYIILIPTFITSIGVQTFRSCNSLRSITISTLSERYLFYSCTKLTTPPQCQQQQVTPIFRRCYYEGFFYKELYIV